MNIFLVPYTWARHIAVALVVGGAALGMWWTLLHLLVYFGPWLLSSGLLWSRGAEGFIFLGTTGAMIAFSSVLAEHTLRRTVLYKRLGFAVIAGAITFFLTLIGYLMMAGIVQLFAAKEMKEIVSDSSLTSLQHSLWLWLAAGFSTGIGPLVIRKGKGIVTHLLGAFTAAGMGAAVWQYLGYHIEGDLFLAAAMGVFAWGTCHGLLVWGIPPELYAGWVRVLSPYRYGYRIPVDHVDGSPSERFVGHFPRGLDLFLPIDQGVAELHTSFVVDGTQRYAIRGLSVQPTLVKRMLERIDLRYDPQRPAPLETQLSMEDIVVMGEGKGATELEFILLPKEER